MKLPDKTIWHELSASDVAGLLESDPARGLSQGEVEGLSGLSSARMR
jgi:hypothetical protein